MLHMGMIKNQKHVWIFSLLQYSSTPILQHYSSPWIREGILGTTTNYNEEITLL